jgi:hypothetical protein
MKRAIRRLAAWRAGVPFKIVDFWPPFYLSKLGGSTEVCPGFHYVGGPGLYDGWPGDEVLLLVSADTRCFYKITDKGVAPGDDHIVSPRTFDLEFSRTSTQTPALGR